MNLMRLPHRSASRAPARMALAWPALAAALLCGCLDSIVPGRTSSQAVIDLPKEEAVRPLAMPTKSFGIYQWNKDSTYETGLQHEISTLGTLPSYAMYFVDRDMGFPKAIVRFNMQRGIKTVLSQELMAYATRDDNHVLDSILAGRWDGYFRRFPRDARASKDLLYYRFG